MLLGHDIDEKVEYYRGFVDWVAVDAAKFLSEGARLYQTAPVLHLKPMGVAAVAEAFFASPLLERIITLDLFDQRLGDEGMRILANSPHLGRLACLELGFNDIGADGLEALVATDKLSSLRWASLGANPVPNPAAEEMVDAGHVLDTVPSEAAIEWERRFGPRPWLHGTDRGLFAVPRPSFFVSG